MPYYSKPESDDARYAFLKRAKVTANQDIEKGNQYVSQDTVNDIDKKMTEYEPIFKLVTEKLSKRSKEVREKVVAIKKLDQYTRDLWEVLKRRALRLDEPAEVLTFYQLPLSGIVPKIKSNEQLFVIVEKIIDGDIKAVTAGYNKMANPSADELKQVLELTRAEADDVAIADREFDAAQEALGKARPELDELIAEVMAELRFNLRKKDEASKRRIMRTYGAEFKYLKGEPVDISAEDNQ